jgi:hypothetical protein
MDVLLTASVLPEVYPPQATHSEPRRQPISPHRTRVKGDEGGHHGH